MRPLLCLLAVLCSVALSACDASVESPVTPEPDALVRVTFDTPISIEEAVEIVGNAGPLLFEHRFPLGDTPPVTSFFVSEPGESATRIASELMAHQDEFVAQLAEDLDAEPESAQGTGDQDLFRAVEAYLAEPSALRSAGVEVSAVSLSADREQIAQFEAAARVAAVDRDRPFETTGEARQLPSLEQPRDAEAASSNNIWVPSDGVVGVYPSSRFPDYRFVKSYAWWNAGVGGFNRFSTYEHDFYLSRDPNDGPNGEGTYFTRELRWTYPAARYAASNLPSAYIDTRFLDGVLQGSPYEIPYTIGSGKAGDILANTRYYTYMVLPEGDADTDEAKLQAQLGYQNPIFCITTWCSYSSGSLKLLRGNGWMEVPGQQSW